MRRIRALAILLVFLLLPTALHADGGTVRVQQVFDDVRVTVFTSPQPLRAGPVDISVLLQDLRTGTPLSQAKIWITAVSRNIPNKRFRRQATQANATNKLLAATQIDLPAAGLWNVEVNWTLPSGAGKVSFDVEAEQALPAWLTIWPWFAWPAAGVILFGVHRVLVYIQTSAIRSKQQEMLL